MNALRSVRNKRFHEAVFCEHCLHQATKLGISIYEASRNGIYLQSIDAEGLVAVLNHRVHGNAGITGKRVTSGQSLSRRLAHPRGGGGVRA